MFKRIYLPASFLIIFIALIGFWRTYFGLIFVSKVQAALLIHLHVVLQIGWLGLFALQAALAANGRIAMHKKVGPWLFIFAVILIVVSLFLTFQTFGAALVQDGMLTAQRKVFSRLRNIIFFTLFLASGWIWRHKPETHKRLMLIATNMLLVPAVGRIVFFGRPFTEWELLIVWPLPIYIAIIYDFITKRIIHPVYLIGFLAMLVMRLCLPLRDTDVWTKFCEWLASFYGN
jgi:uncharacterized membrane protein YozB (DUF420 family)